MLLGTINHNKVDAEHRVELLSNLYLDMIDAIWYDRSQYETDRFNNISVISWWSVLFVEQTVGPGENHRAVASHRKTLSYNAVHLVLIEIRTHHIK